MGGIGLFVMAVVLAVVMVATAGLAVAGATVGSVIDNLDTATVLVTDESGNTETYTFEDLIQESGRVEIIGDSGERVTIDMPVITVEEQGIGGGQVVLGGGNSGLVIDGPSETVRLNGRDVRSIENFDYNRNDEGFFLFRLIGGIFGAMFKLTFWGLIIVGAYLVLRKRQPVVVEKAPEA
jgi:hypothetical protein